MRLKNDFFPSPCRGESEGGVTLKLVFFPNEDLKIQDLTRELFVTLF